MDSSGSMQNAGAIGIMNDAAIEFINQLGPNDEAKVNGKVRAQPFTTLWI